MVPPPSPSLSLSRAALVLYRVDFTTLMALEVHLGLLDPSFPTRKEALC